jgi:biotin carboxyl carrier protein
LVVLEAMKVEHTVTSGRAGKIARVCVAEGELVEAQTLLIVMEETNNES